MFTQLYLYAEYNGKNARVVFDNQPSTSKHYDCGAVQSENRSLHLFSVFCILLPFGLLLFFIILIHTCRLKIHSLFVHSSPVSNVHQNYAALILTGIIFSFHVLICDILAVHHASKPVDLGIDHSNTLPYVITILIIDAIFTSIALVNIFIVTVALNKRSKLMMCCASFFVCLCFWRRFKYHKIDGYDQYNYLPSTNHSDKKVEEMNQHENTLHQEMKLWLLLMSFVAPVACLGTHASFVIMGWSSDPAQATSMTVAFIISFIYYFLGFRQFYVMYSLGPFIKKVTYKHTDSIKVDSEDFMLKTTNIQLQPPSIRDQFSSSLRIPSPSIISLQRASSDSDLHSHARSWTKIQGEPKLHQTQKRCYRCVPLDLGKESVNTLKKEFHFKVLLYELVTATFALSIIEVLTIAVYFFLPAPVSTVPTNILNLLHLTFLVGGGLVAYKLLIFQAPTEQVLLKSILDSYNQKANDQSSPEDVVKQIGNILGSLIKHYEPEVNKPIAKEGSKGKKN